jgi:hypothetical protein
MFAAGDEWTASEIAEALPRTIKYEEHPMLADLERRMAQMAAAKAAEG